MCPDSKKDAVIWLRVPPEVHRRLKLAAAKDGRSMTSFVNRILSEYLKAKR